MMAITIDAGNEVVSVVIVFLCCYGLAAILHGTITLIAQGRAYERDRIRNNKLSRISVTDAVER